LTLPVVTTIIHFKNLQHINLSPQSRITLDENIIIGTWSNEIHFDELEEHENLAGPNHNLPYGSSEKDFFDLYVGRDFCEFVMLSCVC
jgi:hypothetical protein